MDKQDKRIDDFTRKFDELVSKEKLNIDSLETIMINSIQDYEKELKRHAEELLITHVNEKDLIVKKNENGKKKDLN